MPTLRRAPASAAGGRGIPVEFESIGTDRRLPMELESGLFRIIDEALGALPVVPVPTGVRSGSTGRDQAGGARHAPSGRATEAGEPWVALAAAGLAARSDGRAAATRQPTADLSRRSA